MEEIRKFSEVTLGLGKVMKLSSLVSLSTQVLFCYEQFDELTLLHLREFDKKKLISVETDIVVDHYKEETFEDSKPGLQPSLRLYDFAKLNYCKTKIKNKFKSRQKKNH